MRKKINFMNMKSIIILNGLSYKKSIKKGEVTMGNCENVKSNELEKKSTSENELRKLEIEFKNCGYSDEVIEEIKHINGATEVEDFIANLEEELSCWSY